MRHRDDQQLRMPKNLDRKLRWAFRYIFFSRIVRQVKLFFQRKSHRRAFVFALSFLLIISIAGGSSFVIGAPSRYASAATRFAYAERDLESQSIKHQKITYREGEDKISFSRGIEQLQDKDIVVRSEVVERWEHGNYSLGIINSALPGTPVEVHLNYENEDHVHVFEYQPSDCQEQASVGLFSEGCENARELRREEKEARRVLDRAHDLGTLYTDVTGFDPGKDSELVQWLQDMKYIGKEEVGDSKRALFIVQHSEDLRSVLSFDTKTGKLLERRIFVVTPDKEYEMTVVEYGDITWLPSDQLDTIFNPTDYAFEQTSLIPLTQ